MILPKPYPFKRILNWVVVICWLGLYLALAPRLRAHADVVRAVPAPNSVLPVPPEQISIWFTESLESQFAEIRVLDGEGRRVDRGDSRLDAQDRSRVLVSLEPLPEGIYTVVWSNVSSVDGHRVRGSYLFSVGRPLDGAEAADLAQPALQSPLEPLFRWLTLLSIVSVAGGLVFWAAVLQPVVDRHVVDQLQRDLVERMGRSGIRLIRWGLALFGLASLGHLLLQASISYEMGLGQLLGWRLWEFLTDTGWGQLWLGRLGAGLLLAASLGGALPGGSGRRRRLSQGVAIGAALASLLSLSLTSHAAATTGIGVAAVFNDYLHLVAAALWAGGLFHLAWVLPLLSRMLSGVPRRRLLAAVAARFSLLGLASMAMLGMTGFYNSWAQVTLPAALATPYGRVLLFKVGLVILILGLAGGNLLWVRPRLARETEAATHLRALVKGEVVVALLVLLLTGLLTALEPARQVASRQGLGQAETGLTLQALTADYGIDMTIQPGQVGANELLLTLADGEGRPVDDMDQVELQLQYLEEDIGRQLVLMERQGPGRYLVDDLSLSLPGNWQVVVRGYRLNAPDLRAAFRLALGMATRSSGTIAPDPAVGRRWWAGELAVLGLALVWAGWRGWTGDRKRSLAGLAAGMVCLGAGTYLGLALAAVDGSEVGPKPEDQSGMLALPPTSNPFLAEAASVTAGQQVYESHCMVCHGLTGHGDGLHGVGTDAVDLIEHIPLHTASDYFDIVDEHERRGDVQSSPREITVAEIWHLGNYLDALEIDQALAERYFREARTMAAQGEFEAALSRLNQVLELSPRFVQALQGRGIMSLERGDVAQAIADQSRIVTLDPTNPRAYFDRAEAYQQAGRGDLAAADLQQYLALDPQAGNRAALEQRIERLLAETNGSGGSSVSAMLGLDDLPDGFSEIPPAELGLRPGDPAPIGERIEESFVLGHDQRFELVWGYTTGLPDVDSKAAFDRQLNMSSLLAFLSGGLRIGEIRASAALAAPVGLGESSQALSVVLEGGGMPVYLEGVAFRRGDLGVLLFVMVEEGEAATVDWADVALRIAGRNGSMRPGES